jgi:general secretion pathway protein G
MHIWKILVARKSAVMSARGMTLLEIMVVIAIIGIVMTALSVGVVGYLNRARVGAARSQVSTISNAVQTYMLDGECPSSLNALAEGAGALIKAKQLKDPWGQEFVFNCPAARDTQLEFDLCSKGPDKREGSEDDVCND